jgi:hypothetical protein
MLTWPLVILMSISLETRIDWFQVMHLILKQLPYSPQDWFRKKMYWLKYCLNWQYLCLVLKSMYEIHIDFNVHKVVLTDHKTIIRKWEYKQWWSTIPPISTKRTITSDLLSLNTNKKGNNDMWCCILLVCT